VVQPPFDIPGGARVAVLEDASGAMFGIISGGPEPGPYLSVDDGEVGWVELMTRKPEGACAFYNGVFGWDAREADIDATAYTTFSLGDREVAGMIPTPDNLAPDVPDNWSVYFNVADCVATEESAVKLGGQVILSAAPTPMGPFAVLADPHGAVFQIMQFTKAA
jgi:predicted enzyme related to lactoylglutathione lyase